MPDDQTLDPFESTDSDEVRNHDGDTVVNAPDGWSEADKFGMTPREEREGESLDQRLAEEEPDVLEEAGPPTSGPPTSIAVRSAGRPRTVTPSSGDAPVWCHAVSRGIALLGKAIRDRVAGAAATAVSPKKA